MNQIKSHNQHQINYFELNDKKTMYPKESFYIMDQIQRLVEFSKITKEHNILDVGCGRGRYTIPLAKLGYKISGLDLSGKLLKQLAESVPRDLNIPIYESDIINFSPALAGKFDVVVGFFTLHHMHDLRKCFFSIKKLLKTGGQAVFLEPNAFNILYYLQILLTPRMTWKGDGGIIKMRKNLISTLMQEAGFCDFQIHRFGFYPPMIKNSAFGSASEKYWEKISFLKPFLPFQIFKVREN